ncbi:TOPRS ligase, partial [Pheucticus melanocephalus]|nr:TOPRS ligase [Pheucticus melanocephalus]
KAMGTEWSCPICHDEQEGVAYVIPCGHEFCMGCILRWAEKKPECPLCRRLIESVRFSLQEQKYLECVITPQGESPDTSSQAERSLGLLDRNSCQRPGAVPVQGTPSPAEQGSAGTEAVGSLLPKVWAELFQKEEHVLDPMLPWLRQRLEAVYGSQWWLAVRAENTILYTLCLCGPDEEVMVQMLQPLLEEYTEQLVDATVNFIVGQCSEEAQKLLHSHAAGKEGNSPEASSCPTSSQGGTLTWHPSPASSPASSDMEDQPSTSEAALCALRMLQPSVQIGKEQVQPQKEQREVVLPSSSAQGSSHSPIAPCQGWEHSHRGPQHPTERRAPSPQDSPWCTDRPTEREW